LSPYGNPLKDAPVCQPIDYLPSVWQPSRGQPQRNNILYRGFLRHDHCHLQARNHIYQSSVEGEHYLTEL
jgi:hypothetical protein